MWSEVGVGSTFTLRLPAYQQSSPSGDEGTELTLDVLSIPSGEALT